MNITFCKNQCQLGQSAVKVYLEMNESVMDAASDFRKFTANCVKTCPYKAKHMKMRNFK